jgi:O-antigen/teichoic acid export membrane protein
MGRQYWDTPSAEHFLPMTFTDTTAPPGTALKSAALGSALRTLNFFASVIATFLLTPFVVHSLGDRSYGLWLLVGAFIGYYGLFDLGLGTAVSRYIAGALGRDDRDDCRRTFSTAIQCYVLLAGLVILVTCTFSWFSPVLAGDAAEARLFSGVILVLGVSVSLQFVLKPYLGMLQALGRFDVMAGIEILTVLVRSGLIVGVLMAGYGVLALAWATFLSTLPRLVLAVYFCRRFVPWLRFSRQPFRSATTKTLFGYSFYMLIARLGDNLRFNSDSLVITAFLGLAFVTPYGIASSLTMKFKDFMMSLLGVLQPTYSRLEGQGDHERIKRTLFFATKVAMCTSTFIGFALIMWGKAFIERWMGPSYLAAYPCLVVLAVGWTINFWQSPSVSLMYSTSGHRFYALSNSIEAVANVLLSLWWVLPLGILGVALGTAIPMILVRLVVQPYYTCRVTAISGGEYRVMFVGNLLRTFSALLLPLALGFAYRPVGYLELAMAGTLGALTYGIVSWLLLFTSEERTRLLALLPRRRAGMLSLGFARIPGNR